MTDSMNAIDNFLPNVTALAVTHRPTLYAALNREIGFIHVDAETRNARFDAHHLERLPTAHATAGRSRGRDQSIRHRRRRIRRNKYIEARRTQARLIHQVDLAECRIRHVHKLE